jgi:hypothetical protein
VQEPRGRPAGEPTRSDFRDAERQGYPPVALGSSVSRSAWQIHQSKIRQKTRKNVEVIRSSPGFSDVPLIGSVASALRKIAAVPTSDSRIFGLSHMLARITWATISTSRERPT